MFCRVPTTLALICLAAMAGAQKPQTAAVRKELTANYAKMAAAFKKKDPAGVLRFMAPDAVAKLQGGQRIPRSQMDPSIRQQLAAIRTVKKMEYDIERVVVLGKRAIVIVTGKSDVVIGDSTGKLHDVVQHNKVRNTWLRGKKGWQIKEAQMLGVKVWVDGKELKQ